MKRVVLVVVVAVVDAAIFRACATRSSTDLCFSCIVPTWQSRLANADAFNVTCRKIHFFAGRTHWQRLG